MLVLGLLPFALFARLTSVDRVFSAYDVLAYFFPYHLVPARMLAEGHLPLWNPYVYSGIPLLGDGQTALFYPPNWLFLLLRGPAALNYVVLLQFSLAGVATYLFARRLGLWRLPAFVAGVSYMFCGFLTARVVHLSIMSGAALIPLVLLCLDRALTARASPSGDRRLTRRWLAITGLAIAAQTVAGHPQVPVYTALAAVLYTIVRGVEHSIATASWKALARALLLLAGAYLLGAAVAAVQLVPWAEFARLSVRAAGADYGFIFSSSTTGAEWLLLLFPYVLGAHDASPFASGPFPIAAAVRVWEHSGYVGVLPLALALIGVWHLAESTRNTPPAEAEHIAGSSLRRHRWYSMLFFVLLLLTGLTLAAGWNTPFSRITYKIPVLGSLRAVERGLVLASFSLTLLAGFGLQRIVERPQRRPWLLLPAALFLVVPIVFVWLVQANPSRLGLSLHMNPHDLEQLSLYLPHTYVPLLLAFASGLLLVWWSRRPGGTLTHGAAAALVLIDLGLYAVSFNPTAPSASYRSRPQVMQVLRQDDLVRKATFLIGGGDVTHPVARETLAVSWGMVHRVEDINGFNSLQPRRYTDYLFGPRAGDVSYGVLDNLALLRSDSAILSSLNVRYVLVPAWSQIDPGPHLRPVFEDAQVRVFENTQVYPRAYFVERVRRENTQAVLRAVKSPGFDGRRDALVESDDVPSLPPSTTPARAAARRVSPTELRVTTNTAERRFLVVSEMYFPGWRAYIDGVQTPIFRTNYLFRGVVVPAGRHIVTFVYRPSSVLVGAVVSSMALLGIGLLLSTRRRVTRRDAPVRAA